MTTKEWYSRLAVSFIHPWNSLTPQEKESYGGTHALWEHSRKYRLQMTPETYRSRRQKFRPSHEEQHNITIGSTNLNESVDKHILLAKLDLCMAALGLTGESGEFADMVKKRCFHGTPLDLEKAKKELGDIFWYLDEAAQLLGFTIHEVMEENIEKLEARYPEGFSVERSIHRTE